MPETLYDIKRLVKVVQKIIKEPQATIAYKTRKKQGKKEKLRIIKTDITELGKMLKGEKNKPLKKAMDEFIDHFNDDDK